MCLFLLTSLLLSGLPSHFHPGNVGSLVDVWGWVLWCSGRKKKPRELTTTGLQKRVKK